jgi:MFS superfamily sulfate permease-like transporter
LAFLADLLSQPILVGYLAGVALLMIAGQMHTLTGIGPRADSLGAALEVLVQRHGAVHGPSLALAGLALLLMLVLRRWRPHLPGPLLVVLLATAASGLLHLDRQGVAMVGTIEAGLPALVLPRGLTLASWQPLMLGAVGIALVGYSDNMLTARSFAQRHGERIDATKELVALGVTNVATSLFQGFPVSSSNTRTALADTMGARSQRYSLVALVVVLAVLLWLRPLLALFPRPVLGALVVFAALQRKLISPGHRGRAMVVSVAVGSVVAIAAAIVLLGPWLKQSDGFPKIFAATAAFFAIAALAPLFLAGLKPLAHAGHDRQQVAVAL